MDDSMSMDDMIRMIVEETEKHPEGKNIFVRNDIVMYRTILVDMIMKFVLEIAKTCNKHEIDETIMCAVVMAMRLVDTRSKNEAIFEAMRTLRIGEEIRRNTKEENNGTD